jgi:hypothetical protein
MNPSVRDGWHSLEARAIRSPAKWQHGRRGIETRIRWAVSKGFNSSKADKEDATLIESVN